MFTKKVELRKPADNPFPKFPIWEVFILENGVIVERLTQAFNTQTEAVAYAESLDLPYTYA